MLTRRKKAWGAGVGGVLAAASGALINELNAGWLWWAPAVLVVLASAALAAWLAANEQPAADGQPPPSPVTVVGPVTSYNYHGWSTGEELSGAGWNLARYYAYLDLDRFTGRRELIAQIEEFIKDNTHGWVVIEGEAGVGKSALAAHLVSSSDWFHHFTWFSSARSPENARKNLAVQLISVFGLDNRAPGGKLPSNAGEPKYLAAVLEDAADKRDKEAAKRPIVLVIDTLDEIDSEAQSRTPLGLPRAEELPRKVFVIVTRRPAPPLRSVGSPILPLSIAPAFKMDENHHRDVDKRLGSANTDDMREYLRKLFDGPNPDLKLAGRLRSHDMTPGEFADTLVTRCAGVWIYLKYVLDDVREERREPADVVSLPGGLRTYYLELLQRQQERDHGKWEHLRLPSLATLAALRRPVALDELASLAGISDAAEREELRSWLDEDMRALLHKDRKSYEIHHQSLRDLMATPRPPRQANDEDQYEDYNDDDLAEELPDALRAAHLAITAALMPADGDWSKAGDYVRNSLAEHAANAERLDELVADPGFLLVCQPSSVLLRRQYLKSLAGMRAVSAYEAALNEWTGLPDDGERAWRLHVWARKTGAPDLAVACSAIAARTPMVQAAMWTGSTHRSMQAHDGSVQTITVLPQDGRPLLASGGSDGLVRLWDPSAGTPEGDPLADLDDGVTVAVAVSLPGHQLVLATGAKDGKVWLWSPEDKEPFDAPLSGHSGPVSAIAAVRLAEDRTVLATGGRDGNIRIWDPAKRAPGGDSLAHRGPVTAAAAVPVQDGQLLATGASDGTTRLWDLSDRQPAGAPLPGHSGPVSAIAAVKLAENRTVVATGGRDGVIIRLWNPRTRLPVADLMTDNSEPVNAITVARLANRTFFAAAGQDRRIRLWDAATGAAALSLSVGARWVNAIAAVPLPEGRTLLATGGSGGRIELQELYESATGAPATAPSSGHSGHDGQVSAIAVTKLAGQTVFVSGSRDRTVRLWNPLTGEAVKDPLAGPMGPLRAVAAVPLPDGRNLIAASDTDGTVQLWDPATTPPTCWPLEHYAQVYAITAVRLPERTLLAVGGDDGTVRLWDPVTGKPAGRPLAGHGGQRVNTIASARLPDGFAVLVTGGSDGTVQLWDPVTGVALGNPLNWQVGRIRAVAPIPMPGGRTLFAAGGDQGLVQVWDGNAERGPLCGPPAGQRAPVNAIAAVQLPGRTLLATGGDDHMVRLWNPETGESAAGSWVGHTGPVKALASVRLPGGLTLLASGGDDKTILVWDVRLVPDLSDSGE